MTEEEKKKKIEALFQEAVDKIEEVKSTILTSKENRASAEDKEKIGQILDKIKKEL